MQEAGDLDRLALPLDAPGGVWYAYPDKVIDAAGNEARATFAGGKFTLSGVGVASPKQVQAATFIVPTEMIKPGELPDLAQPPADLMASFPATLTELKVTPSAVTRDGDFLTVRVTWMDLSGTLK